MKFLILGGTVFLGRYLVECAVNRGHEVTIFHRGLHQLDKPIDVEELHGDRRGDLGAFTGRRWDRVIDTCGYVPSAVRASARILSDSIDHYTFISSQSVYANFDAPGIDESYPVSKLTDVQVQTAEAIKPSDGVVAVSYGEMYGGLKVRCERTLEDEMPGRSLSIRSGLIVGTHDYSDRFTYWVRRVAEGGEVLAPGEANSPVQLVDVRDLADWIVKMSEARQAGIFNATGPDHKLTMRVMLEACRDASSSDARFTWVDEEFLKNSSVAGWSELPLWLPTEMNLVNFFSIDCSKAITAGLAFRSMIETAKATFEWDRSRDIDLRAGLTRERELELLRVWHGNQ